jgi:hypothetical protein
VLGHFGDTIKINTISSGVGINRALGAPEYGIPTVTDKIVKLKYMVKPVSDIWSNSNMWSKECLI